MKINIKYKYKLLLLFLGVAFIAFGFLGDDKNGSAPPKALYRITATQSSGKQGDAYGMNVNNIWLPINSKGIIADVNIDTPMFFADDTVASFTQKLAQTIKRLQSKNDISTKD